MKATQDWPIVGEEPDRTPTDEQLERAATLRCDAAYNRRASQESFDRCDTDGCVSQWCSDWTARERERQASLLERGCWDLFPALFQRNEDGSIGARVRARLVRGQYGPVWCVVDENDRAIEWVGDAKRQRTFARKGYVRGEEWAHAWAKLGSNGHGLSGLATMFVRVYRTDGGCPEWTDAIGPGTKEV